jgi:type IV secretory pathway ATPase VirB11/archaellum biosynthesis ATPase
MTPADALADLSRALGLGPTDPDGPCACEPSFDEPAGTDRRTELHLDATDCPGGGDLASSPACRATAVAALADRDADVVRTRAAGVERTYADAAAALLVAAGRFVERAAYHDARLADRAARDPLAAAHEATGRAGPVARIAAETGLALGAERTPGRERDRSRDGGYETALPAFVAPTVARCRVDVDPPARATLVEGRELDSGARVRLYDADGGRCYHLLPAWTRLDGAALETLAAARRLLATGGVDGGRRAPGRAVRRVADDGDPVERLAAVLAKHTLGHGLLDDLFADPRVTDVSVTGPVSENPVRVVVDGERLPTNVRLSPDGAAALASRFRRASGRAFSRATPTLDATVEASNGRRVRVAGVAPPASEGLAFAFRTHDEAAWTLARLVALGTLPAAAAGLLSVAVERGAATLVAGPRGAGKTTTLGALLRELPAGTRTVVVEDTPELPVSGLQAAGRDVQAIRTGLDDGAALPPDEALRAALRLGDGALVIGEVRGEEAATLYEAMRVGAADGAVLGTIHGVGGDAVRDRVVADLGVPERAFGATDLVVTLTARAGRRVTLVEEVRRTGDGTHVVPLFEAADGGSGSPDGSAVLRPTGVVDRGESTLVASLAAADESYADVRAAVAARARSVERLADAGLVAPGDGERDVNGDGEP